MFSDSMLEDILKLVKFNLDDEMFITDKEILLNMISKKASINERQEILTLLADKFNVTLFSQSDSSMIPKLVNKGYVNYSNDMPLIFANSKINLNISLRSIVRGIPLRALDVMGAGGFLLSNYQPELAEMFIDGEEMVMYYSREDLVQKVKYYLENDEERCRIAENGRKKIEREFDYGVAWKKIFDIVG